MHQRHYAFRLSAVIFAAADYSNVEIKRYYGRWPCPANSSNATASNLKILDLEVTLARFCLRFSSISEHAAVALRSFAELRGRFKPVLEKNLVYARKYFRWADGISREIKRAAGNENAFPPLFSRQRIF